MIGCQHQIKQWHQAATYGLEGEAKFDTSGALMHLNDIEALKPESGAHQQLPKLAAGEKIYGSSLLTDPAKHNHLHFCYFVHAVGTAANAVISRDVPQKEQHAREEYLRHRSIRFFHPEACGDTNALCMSLVNQDTKQGIYGNVGYIFAPAEGRIAYAAKEDMKTKNWDENSILRTIAAMSSEGRTPVMPAEKLLEKGLSQQNSAEQHNEVLVWGNHSKAGHFQSHDESLIPIGTFSVLNSKGQDRCPEQAAWMRKHSQDFNIPHVQLAASLGQPEILTLNHSDADLVSKFAVLKDMRVCQK